MQMSSSGDVIALGAIYTRSIEPESGDIIFDGIRVPSSLFAVL